jgi:hypothetical protein
MRLLNTKTMELKEFFDDRIPPYAILSHRWEQDELSYQDLQAGRNRAGAGFTKVQKCCDKASTDGKRFEWLWVDTCCIDKSSSAELSEAINSMFRWYRDAQVCYAYLSDVPAGCTTDSHHEAKSPFRRSQWFTRGWTLQELIAPSSVIFLDQAWTEIGTRQSLEQLISSITGVENLNEDDESENSPLYRCVAEKMSWASERVTTRREDIAYCLMGLFWVNMPVIYGEGRKAFMRLQLEIMRQDNDASIFAWTGRIPDYIGALAISPADFQNSANVRFDALNTLRPSFSMANEGLRLDCFRVPDPDPSHLPFPTARRPSLVPIGCYRDGVPSCLSICLYQYGPSETGCYRVYNSYLFSIDDALLAEVKVLGAVKRPGTLRNLK